MMRADHVIGWPQSREQTTSQASRSIKIKRATATRTTKKALLH